jgi:hypothetical protein
MAIVIHAARATRHWIGPGVRRGERIYHVLSDLEGEEGRRELVAFVADYGMRSAWIQYAGTYREHYDAPERIGLRMLAAGARPATNREVGELLARKKRGMAELTTEDEPED